MSSLNSDGRAMPYRNLGGTGLMVSALSFGYASPQPACYLSHLLRRLLRSPHLPHAASHALNPLQAPLRPADGTPVCTQDHDAQRQPRRGD
jgi:hypothetical protein